MKEIIIAGSGFTGAYIGRNLAEQGWKVKIFEIRNHIAGNMYDAVDKVYMYAGLAEFKNPDLIDYDLPNASTIGELVERMKEINLLYK